jgi:hypothetical protein
MSEYIAQQSALDMAAEDVFRLTDEHVDMDTALRQTKEKFGVSGPDLTDRVNAVIGLGKTASLFEDYGL